MLIIKDAIKIIETEKGFETLSVKLEDWIDEKYNEIQKGENV